MEEQQSMNFQRMWFEAKKRLARKADKNAEEGTGSYSKSLDVLNKVEMDTVE